VSDGALSMVACRDVGMGDARDTAAVAVPSLADRAAVCTFVVGRKSRFCTKAAQLVDQHEGASRSLQKRVAKPLLRPHVMLRAEFRHPAFVKSGCAHTMCRLVQAVLLYRGFCNIAGASSTADDGGEQDDAADGASDGVSTPAFPGRNSSLSAALQLAKRLDRLRPEWERWQACLRSRCGGIATKPISLASFMEAYSRTQIISCTSSLPSRISSQSNDEDVFFLREILNGAFLQYDLDIAASAAGADCMAKAVAAAVLAEATVCTDWMS